MPYQFSTPPGEKCGLVGLVRIKASTKWGYPLNDKERDEYAGFVNEWHSKCVESLKK